jgi:hypothetical protein
MGLILRKFNIYKTIINVHSSNICGKVIISYTETQLKDPNSCESGAETTTMEIVTLLLSSTLLVAVLLFLFRKDCDRARLHRMVTKVPGPLALPLVGNVVPFMFLKNYGE